MRAVISRRSLVLGAGAGAAATLSGCGSSRSRRLVIAAGDEAGIYIAFARLLARRLEDRADGLRVDVLRTEGTEDNLERLRSGSADLGLGLSDGVQRDREIHTAGAPEALARIYENYLQLVVPSAGPVRSVSDLAGRSISLGASASGASVTGTIMLRAARLSTDAGSTGVEVRHGSLVDALQGVAQRTLDALLWSGGIPTPAISHAAEQGAMQMIALDSVVSPMREVSGFDYRLRRVPEVNYRPASGGGTVGVPNLLLCRPGLSPDLARVVVLTLAQDARKLIPGFAQGRLYLSPPTMIQTGTVPLHRGAVDAYRRLHE